MARLIVNADDFGYTAGINRAIVELHGAGAITSTTLMACGPAFNDANGLLHGAGQARGLGVGCHVVLVDGRPSAPEEQIPSLLTACPAGAWKAGRQAAFSESLHRFVTDLLRGLIREDEIETEAVAQIRRLQEAGVHVTHLDTHKHTHIFPGVLRPLLRAALRCGVRRVRNPFEPAWSMAATTTAPLMRRTQFRLLRTLHPGFMRLVTDAGIITTQGSLGILATGKLDTAILEALLRAAGAHSTVHAAGREQTWELVCHPGYEDQALAHSQTRLKAAREIEHAALLSVTATLKSLPLLHFGELGT